MADATGAEKPMCITVHRYPAYPKRQLENTAVNVHWEENVAGDASVGMISMKIMQQLAVCATFATATDLICVRLHSDLATATTDLSIHRGSHLQ